MKDMIIEKMGSFMKNIPNEHDKEYIHGYQMQHNTVMQKLVPTNIIELDLRIQEESYFKSQIFLDYLTSVLSEDRKIIKNLSELQKHLPKKEELPLNIDIIVTETGLLAKEGIYNMDKASVSTIMQRYEDRNQKPQVNGKTPDLYYKGISEILYDMVSDENKRELLKVEGKNDFRALVFTDVVENRLKDASSKIKVAESMKSGFLHSSIKAMELLKDNVDIKDLRVILGDKYDQ